MIILGMADTVAKLRMMSGADKPVVDFGNGVSIVIEEQDSRQHWRNRLVEFQDAVSVLTKANPGMDSDDVSMAILEADGWSITSVTLRTPMWMASHEEISRDDVAREFEVFNWIAISSLETR